LLNFSFYINFINLQRARRQEFELYFCLRICELREIGSFWGLDKISTKSSFRTVSEITNLTK
jgi:hypothetical protein